MAGEPTGDATIRRRPSAPLAVAVGLAYIGWRAYDTLAGVNVWLAVGALVVEAAGFAGTTALLYALRRPRRRLQVDQPAGGVPPGRVDVVVRFDGQSIGHLHATLAGVRHMFDVHRIAVITDRVDEASKAVRHTGAEVIAPDRKDTSRLRVAGAFGDAPLIAVFDAGDVPLPGFTGVVRGAFVDPTVGISQGCLVPDGVDSAEHDAHGHHELRFERQALNPSLGARGGAVLSGSGAIIRRSVLQDVRVPRGSRRTAELRWSIAVRAAGHAVVAPSRPIVSAASINTERAVLAERRRSARAALTTLVSPELWTPRLGGAHRAGYLAWTVRPLSGLRRVAFLAALIACIVTNRSPIDPQSSVWVVVGLWAAWFVLQAYAVEQMSNGLLKPGDRTRWSMRTMGASLAAWLGAGRKPAGEGIDAGRPGGLRGAGRNRFLVVALLAVAAASVGIGVDRWQPFLGAVSDDQAAPWTRAALAAVAVWAIASMLDVMRCLIGGPQLRGAQRLRVRLDATVDDGIARITNLSPRGAAVQFEHEPDVIVGDQVTMRFLVPTGSDTTAEVATIATVRSIRYDDSRAGSTMACGLEFGAMDRVSADALFDYCAVVHPGRFTDTEAAAESAELVAASAPQQRFIGVRLLGAIAVLGIAAAMMPPYGVTAAASASASGSVTVHLIDATDGTPIEGADLAATCVAARHVVDDHDDVLELARSAIRRTRAQQRARQASIVRQAAERDLRREIDPSKRAAQEARWHEQQRAIDDVVDEPSAAGDVPASVAWHHVVAVQATDSEPVDADEQSPGTYVFGDLSGWPCRVQAVGLPSGYGPAPLDRGNGGLVQFADGGTTLMMMAARTVGPATIEIGNRVWLDADSDGLQDPDEPGLAGVPVTLTVDGIAHQVVTDVDGGYRFSSGPIGGGPSVEAGIVALRPGAAVQIATPVTVQRGSSSFHVTVQTPDGPGRFIGSAVSPATGTTSFAIGDGGASTIRHDLDIGYAQGHALGDRVWMDADNDGHLGLGEAGVDGVTLLLYLDDDADGVPDGDPVDAQVTSQGGSYAFGGLPAGRYVVEVHPPDGMVSSTGQVGHLDGPVEPATTIGIDDDDDGTMLATGVIRSGTITLGGTSSPTGEVAMADTSAGAVIAGVPDVRGDATVDFGLFAARAIDDALWVDEDGDGRLSPDEPGLADVPLALVRGDQVLATTVSDVDGDFEFPNLVLGEYAVQVQAPAGLRPIDVLPPQTDDGELMSALDDEGQGETIATDGTTGVDATVDATVDTEPIETVPVDTVLPVDGTGDVDATQIAATAPLPAEDPPIEVFPVTIAPDWAGPDSARVLQRFGLWAPRSIGDRVWEDADDDGVIDATEVGIPGMAVSLVEGDRVVARTLSAVDGTYRFTDLPDGTYRVAVDVPITWRTSSVGWADATAAGASSTTGVDNGAAARATGRALTPPIRIGRVDVDAMASFGHADLGLFQPRPQITLTTSVGSSSSSTAGTDGPVFVTGSAITVRSVVANTGNVTVSSLTVSDDATPSAALDCNGAQPGDGQPMVLDVGRSVTCTTGAGVGTGPGHRTTTVDASGESSPGAVVALAPAQATANWTAAPPGLTLRTLVTVTQPGIDADHDGVLDGVVAPHLDGVDDADVPGGADQTANHVVAEGTRVWWLYEVRNTGTDPLADVAVTDQQRGRVCSGLGLAPGDARYCSIAETLTRGASDGGQRRAVATAQVSAVVDPTGPTFVTAVPVGQALATPTDAAHAFVVQPGVAVAVSVDGSIVLADGPPAIVPAGVGAKVSYAVTNTGDVPIASIALTDANGAPIDCPDLATDRDALRPGSTQTCTVDLRPDAPPLVMGRAALPAPVSVGAAVHVDAQPAGAEGGVLPPVVADAAWSYSVSTVAIADEAFVDADGNGVHDPVDTPLGGVEVHLLDDHDQLITTTVTDQTGRWGLGSLPAGTYSVEYVVPPGYRVAVTTASGTTVVEPDPTDRTLVTDRATIDSADVHPPWHLAVVAPAAVAPSTSTPTARVHGSTRIEDRVWNDVDGDGWLTADERGFANVVVTLVDGSTDVARPVAVTTTDSVGRFTFVDVPTGKYVVAIGTVADGSPLADLMPVVPAPKIRDADDLRPAVRTAGWSRPIIVAELPVLQSELSLAVAPATIGRLAPGRQAPAGLSLLDPAGLVPTSPTEVGEALVFVISLVVFSLVIATARRRRLA